MNSADLKYRIEIYQAVRTSGDFGRTNTDYEYKCSTRARVNYISGNREMDNDEIVYPVERTFIVRSYVPVTETDEIRYDNKRWIIISIDRIREYNDIVIRTTLRNV